MSLLSVHPERLSDAQLRRRIRTLREKCDRLWAETGLYWSDRQNAYVMSQPRKELERQAAARELAVLRAELERRA